MFPFLCAALICDYPNHLITLIVSVSTCSGSSPNKCFGIILYTFPQFLDKICVMYMKDMFVGLRSARLRSRSQ